MYVCCHKHPFVTCHKRREMARKQQPSRKAPQKNSYSCHVLGQDSCYDLTFSSHCFPYKTSKHRICPSNLSLARKKHVQLGGGGCSPNLCLWTGLVVLHFLHLPNTKEYTEHHQVAPTIYFITGGHSYTKPWYTPAWRILGLRADGGHGLQIWKVVANIMN
jgi:hypothetical protein